MPATIYVLHNDEMSRIAVVVATSDESAYRFFAQAEYPENDTAELDHIVPQLKRYWKIIKELPATTAGAVVAATVDRSEGFNVY